MTEHLPVYAGDNALERLIAFCTERDLRRFALVADANTYAALGRRAEAAIRGQGWDVDTIILQGDDIGADAQSVYQVLLGLDKASHTFVAVGSGTVTDVARFVSHRSNTDFISLPTAASVDGYTSIGAPMIVGGVKITETCQGPIAVFGDLPTLCAAPRALTASGFGDLIAKLTSVADWEIGHLAWDEPFDPIIAERARKAVWNCVAKIDSLASAQCDGVQALFDGLIESGFCMLDFGETRPASGYEHHVSHFWEMMLLREGRHSVFHGAKVGVAVLASAEVYDKLRQLTVDEVRERLQGRVLPDRNNEEAFIRNGYGAMADQIIAVQEPFLGMTQEELDVLCANIVTHWPNILRIARLVPPSHEMRSWLEKLGGATSPGALGLSQEEYLEGLRYGSYYRARFTGKRLALLLGL